MGHGRRLSHDRLERRRYGEARMRQGRDRQGDGLDGDEQLQARGALRILAPGNRRIVVMRGVTCSGMAAEVRVHAARAVVPVVVMVVQVRVQQGRTQRRQLEGGSQRNRNGRSQHRLILNPYLLSVSELFFRSPGAAGACATIR
jgi:hypothetical protein